MVSISTSIPNATPATGSAPVPGLSRRISGFKPTGRLHLGNYLGAVAPMVQSQAACESIVMIVDLHALTVEHDPQRLRQLTREVLGTLVACGVDPATSTCYVQSDVPEHAELHYLLECSTGYGEAARMIQFREKAAAQQQVRLSLLTYPVLMAGDILLHDADDVPVGDDQDQHVELARDVANRFNTRYGRTFVVPRATHPAVAARVMDLSRPESKMGKSSTSEGGIVFLLDSPDVVRHKVARAVTDGGGQVTYDPVRQPGVANLVEILAALRHLDPAQTANEFDTYRQLKEAVTESIVDTLEPVRRRYQEVSAEADYLDQIRRAGAEQARSRAGDTVRRAKRAIGLSPDGT